MRDLNVIQYNCGNANGGEARPFFDMMDPAIHPIISIQEPLVRRRGQHSTYCPRNYRLSRSLQEGNRVVFMIHERIPNTEWEVLRATPHCEYLMIGRGEQEVRILNVYNPIGASSQPTIETWPTIKECLQDNHPRTMVVGDFNSHYPEWAGPTTTREDKAQHLLQQMEGRGLSLLNDVKLDHCESQWTTPIWYSEKWNSGAGLQS
jgi:hypothetical protein